MDRQRTLRSLGLTLVAALMLFAGVVGCSLSDLFPSAGVEIQFWASEEVVPPGGCVMLHWEVSGAEDNPVFLDGREVSPQGEDEVCLDEPTTFELVLGAPGGSIRETVTIEVEGEWQEPPPGEEPPPEEPPPGEEPPPEGGPEHVMLVDLARNDVARVCVPGTRRVTDPFSIERYSHVQHLVSRVKGTLLPGLDPLHAYRASANMGTLTGAPKLRAMELIRENEPHSRGYYGVRSATSSRTEPSIAVS